MPDRGNPAPNFRERGNACGATPGNGLRVRRAAAELRRLTPTSEVQQVPPEQALAILGHMVADPEGKEIGRLVDVLVDRDRVSRRPR